MADTPGVGPVPQPGAQGFTEAIDFLRQKINLPTKAWTDLWEGQHARAFVVAGATQAQLIADLRAAVDAALADGETLEQFRTRFDEIVAKAGWSYKGNRGWRTAVIFNTNLRMAYQAGRWAQIQKVKSGRPYLRYVAVMDRRTRHLHREWHNTVLPVDDPWWEHHYPPNGWNCRCTVMSLSQRDIDNGKYKLSDKPPPGGNVDKVVHVNGEPVEISVPRGIDPGFGYNVGQAGYGVGQSELAALGPQRFVKFDAPWFQPPPIPEPVAPKAEMGARVQTVEEARQALFDVLGGPEAVYVDPTGTSVLVNQALIDHLEDDAARLAGARERYFPFIPEIIEEPQEIWVGFRKSDVTGKVVLARRYLRIIALDKDKAVGLVTDVQDGIWTTRTFFQADKGTYAGIRSGRLIYSSDG